ncbi:cytochrome c5 family protein [Hyphomonas sp.]|uniref:c-type cytochrome n=1 Tax=Hyphomonas sp. TaxID=87 RepID=UPI0035277F1C
MVRTFSATLLLACICACSRGVGGNAPPEIVEPDAPHIALAETLVPSDPTLAATYERSCRACHALNGLGAPLTGHSAAWTPRFEARGTDGLLASVHSGRGAMPAMGYCADCTDDDFRALIQFMSAEGQP